MTRNPHTVDFHPGVGRGDSIAPTGGISPDIGDRGSDFDSNNFKFILITLSIHLDLLSTWSESRSAELAIRLP